MGFAEPAWLKRGFDLWVSMVPLEVDFFLPRMTANMSAFTDRLATASDLAGMLASTLLMIRVPLLGDQEMGEATVTGSAGNRSAEPALTVTFKQETFIHEALADSLTGHSERGTLQSLMAGIGVPKAERQYLGRWSASGADEYVQTYKLMVKRLLGKLAAIMKGKDVYDMVDDAEAYESLKDKAEKRRIDPEALADPLRQGMVNARDLLLSLSRRSGGPNLFHFAEAAGEDDLGAPAVPALRSEDLVASETHLQAPAGPAPALEGLMEVSEESDAEKDGKFAKYVVADCKVRTGGRVSRLHLRKGCYLGRSLSFTSYELLYVDPPPARSYTDFCRRCWPKGRPKENLAELTSESNGDTTSSDTEDGADEIMQESIAELEEKKSP